MTHSKITSFSSNLPVDVDLALMLIWAEVIDLSLLMLIVVYYTAKESLHLARLYLKIQIFQMLSCHIHLMDISLQVELHSADISFLMTKFRLARYVQLIFRVFELIKH